MKELKERLKKIKHLKDMIDCLLITGNDPSFFYFTNSPAEEILLYDFHKPVIITTPMGMPQLKGSWVKNLETVESRKQFMEKIKEKAAGRVGLNKNVVSARFAGRIRNSVDIGEELEKARAVKTGYEIRLIKKVVATNQSRDSPQPTTI